MNSFRNFLEEGVDAGVPEEFNELPHMFSQSVDDELHDILKDRNIIEKGYAELAKCLKWNFVKNRVKVYSLSAEIVKNNDGLYIIGKPMIGTTSFSSVNPTAMFKFKLTFNKKGICNGIEKTATIGYLKISGQEVADFEGLTFGKIKSTMATEFKWRFNDG